jgi:hypothetical protein
MTQIAHIYDGITGESIDRPLNDEETALLATNEKYAAKVEADRKAKEAARAAVLDKLGLTADEAAALLG